MSEIAPIVIIFLALIAAGGVLIWDSVRESDKVPAWVEDCTKAQVARWKDKVFDCKLRTQSKT